MRTCGPIPLIESATSVPLQWGLTGRLWLASARMVSSLQIRFGGRFDRRVIGTGWGRSARQAELEAKANAIIKLAMHAHAGNAHVEPLGWGISCASRTSPDEVTMDAILRWAGDWCLDQIDRGLAIGLRRLHPPVWWRPPERSLQNHTLWTTKMQVNQSGLTPRKLTVVIALSHSSAGGIHLATGAADDVPGAATRALRQLYLKKRTFENVRLGREQLLDQLRYQRLWLLGVSRAQAQEISRRLEGSLSPDGVFTSAMSVSPASVMKGPWEPASAVGCASIHHIEPMNAGGLERWIH